MTPPFTIEGPDGDGFVWLRLKNHRGNEVDYNLGPVDQVSETLSQWLASIDQDKEIGL